MGLNEGATVIPFPQSKSKEAYTTDPAFEKQVVTLCCSRPRFYGRLRTGLDPECFSTPAAKLAMRACVTIAKELGRGPDSAIMVIQRLRRWMGEGKVTQAEIEEVGQIFDDAEDAGLMTEDGMLNEFAPVLRRRAEREAVQTAVSEYGKKGNIDAAFEQLSKARAIGTNDSSVGTLVGPGSFAQLERLKQVQRLPTGIIELDDVLGGGVMRGTEAMFLGGPGDGKSMALCQVAAEGARLGFHVGFATLELPEPIQLARIKANLTGLLIDDILDDPDSVHAQEALAKVQARPGFGRIIVKEFSPMSTTVDDIRAWVKSVEEELGFPMQVVVIDYADKLVTGKDEDNAYTLGKMVFEGLRVFANETQRWLWTASQATRDDGKKASKKLDIGDTADSMHKPRVADLVITLNARDEGTQMVFFVAKNRLGAARKTVGPLPVDWERARIAPLNELEEAPF